jgi:Zn-dependent M16 (insulinase) family peptidase
MPYGLQLMLGCMNACIHYDNPISMLDLDENFTKLKEKISKEGYIESLIESALLSNSHRLTYELKPDSSFNDNLEEYFSSTLKEKEETLTDLDKNKIIKLADDLKARQEADDDASLLPKVTIEDIPLKREYSQSNALVGNRSIYEVGTNGLVYSDFLFPCSSLTNEELLFSSLYTFIVTEVGIQDKSYEEIQAHQSKISGGINAAIKLQTKESSEPGTLFLSLASKCLEENFNAMEELIFNTIKSVRFDEEKRILDLLNIFVARNDESLNQNGHYLAMNSAASSLNTLATTSFHLSGLQMIHRTKELISKIQLDGDASYIINILQNIHSKVSNKPYKIFTACSKDALKDKLEEFETSQAKQEQQLINAAKSQIAWITGSQVCYCAQAFAGVAREHPDSAALSVLATVLRNGFLHTAIREKGGAYGAGASNDTATNTFKLFSYRDPKCKETFQAFEDAISWAKTSINEQHLEEAILGVVSSIDKPLSPVGEAKNDFNFNLEDINIDERLAFRQRIINCSIEDLVRVNEKYLTKESKRSILAGESFKDQAEELKLEILEV